MKKIFRGKRGFLILLLLLCLFLNVCRSTLVDFKWLQQQEFTFYDHAQVRAFSSSLPSEEIVIVGITEEDLKNLQVDTLEDQTLAILMEKIQQQQPVAIGLDLIRDLPVGEGREKLEQIYRTSDNLYGVGKFTGIDNDAYFQKIDPPPVLFEKGKVGDVSLMVDDDGVVRRGNLFPTTGEEGIPSLGLILAHRYLIEKGYPEKTSPSKDLQLGEIVFPTSQGSDGGYVNADDSGYQILMNWYPPQSFSHVSVSDVLSGNVADNFFTDKIVLIGYYTISLKKDIFDSPFRAQTQNQTPREIFGVEVHANLISYLINVVTQTQPQLKAVPDAIETIILTFWIVLTGILVWLLKVIRPPLALISSGLALAATLVWLCWQINYQIFVLGWWLPIYPTVAIVVTAVLSLFYLFRERNLEQIENLELKVKERTSELESALSDLEQQKNQLIEQQKQLIEQEKLAFLGRLTAGFCHQFKNPLYALKYNFQTVANLLTDLDLESAQAAENIDLVREVIADLDEPIDKLELLFKLILISPTRKNIVWLEAKPNSFVSSVVASCLRFKFLDRCGPSIKIKKELDPALEEKMQVPQQLEIPIFNILDNALDALLNRIDEDNFIPLIEVTTKKLEQQWQITIRDNGGGIPPEILQTLFTPFVTTKPETHGIGLGLWISQEMLEKIIGGQISVSVDGEYTTFFLTIPLKM